MFLFINNCQQLHTISIFLSFPPFAFRGMKYTSKNGTVIYNIALMENMGSIRDGPAYDGPPCTSYVVSAGVASSIFWDVTQHTILHRRFGGVYSVNIQGLRTSKVNNQQEAWGKRNLEADRCFGGTN
jgi:hypothetical protein